MVFLGYAASPNFQRDVGDRLGLAQSSVCNIIHRVARSLCLSADSFIRFPTTEEDQRQQQAEFFRSGLFPRVIGVLDGTHFRIQRHNRQETFYTGYKKYHTINSLMAVRADGQFSFVDVSKPGRSSPSESSSGIANHSISPISLGAWHDSAVLQGSALWRTFESGAIRGKILADKGFPARPWLLTPIRNPRAQSHFEYNRAHLLTRNPIEKAFGLLKRRFFMLSTRLRLKLDNIAPFIMACCVLHNIAIQRRLSVPSEAYQEEDNNSEDGSESEEEEESEERRRKAKRMAMAIATLLLLSATLGMMTSGYWALE